MEHHLQQKKIMLPSLEYRIFYFWLKFVSFTQVSRQHFPKSGFIIFKYVWRNVLMQNIQKIHEADPEKNASLTDGQTNKWMDGKD